MKIFKVQFTDNIELYYSLIEADIADRWANLISQKTVDNCCKINHYTGQYDWDLVRTRIQELYDLADVINQHVPKKIKKVEFTPDNYEHAFNVMHVHFPEYKFKPGYEFMWDCLSKYNDTIHWLEATLPSCYLGLIDNKRFSIKLDFNKDLPVNTYPFNDEDYNFFNGYFSFGQLMIHYVHVGRHALELFQANDLHCPQDQFVPQRAFNASARLHFFDNLLDSPGNKEVYRLKWGKFFTARGGKEFFGFDIDDPKLAFGYCHIGQLSKIIIDGVYIAMPKTIKDITIFRTKLAKTKILNWEII